MNLQGLGEELMASTISVTTGYKGKFTRGSSQSFEFFAGRPPDAHEYITDSTGSLHLSQHSRVLFFELSNMGPLGLPQQGDIWTDQCNREEWKVLNNDAGEAWEYHGQGRKMVRVLLKRDK